MYACKIELDHFCGVTEPSLLSSPNGYSRTQAQGLGMSIVGEPQSCGLPIRKLFYDSVLHRRSSDLTMHRFQAMNRYGGARLAPLVEANDMPGYQHLMSRSHCHALILITKVGRWPGDLGKVRL